MEVPFYFDSISYRRALFKVKRINTDLFDRESGVLLKITPRKLFFQIKDFAHVLYISKSASKMIQTMDLLP